MTEKQLTFKESEIIQILNKVYLNFKEGLFKESITLLEQALAIDFEYPGVASALKCANFWVEREERLKGISSSYEKGEYYLNQWKVFNGFIDRMPNISERCIFTIKHYIYGQALEHYLALYNKSELNDPEILLRIGRCYKGRGNFESAISFIELASQQKRDDAIILAELADSYSLVNENRAARVFFREAFFLDPQSIELSYFESPMIQRLIEKLREHKFNNTELREWIPVYGTVYGLFHVKRELRPLELGKLKQSIYQLEKEIEQEKQNSMIPRLINRYFWLIDHYVNTSEDRLKIEEILQKIKELDPLIYEEYIN